jgi:hypothetical protein
VQATAGRADGTPVKSAGTQSQNHRIDVDGKVLRRIKLGSGSAAGGAIATWAMRYLRQVGNLYVAETGIAGGSLSLRSRPAGGASICSRTGHR